MKPGCGVVVSDSVGCGADFKEFERFRIFKQNNIPQLSAHVQDLLNFDRSFDWSFHILSEYSVQASADSIASLIQTD
jgi:hypothetical protein